MNTLEVAATLEKWRQERERCSANSRDRPMPPKVARMCWFVGNQGRIVVLGNPCRSLYVRRMTSQNGDDSHAPLSTAKLSRVACATLSLRTTNYHCCLIPWSWRNALCYGSIGNGTNAAFFRKACKTTSRKFTIIDISNLKVGSIYKILLKCIWVGPIIRNVSQLRPCFFSLSCVLDCYG